MLRASYTKSTWHDVMAHQGKFLQPKVRNNTHTLKLVLFLTAVHNKSTRDIYMIKCIDLPKVQWELNLSINKWNVAIGALPCSFLRSRHTTVMIMYVFFVVTNLNK